MNLVLFLAGLVALVLGAKLLVLGASHLARSFGISPLVVGLTIVACGTSAPEIAVSVGAAWRGVPDLAVGNVVGSNIFNVLFILGVSALITPLVVHAQIVRQEVPIMIGASVLLTVQALDGRISRSEAALLFGLLLVYVAFLVHQSRKEAPLPLAAPADDPEPGAAGPHWSRQVLLVAAGLALLVLGSGGLVRSATAFAQTLGVSDVVIALTVVAAGTSLPEVATSVTAALRGERDIAVGNVVGSNTFNVLGCLGASGMVSAGGLPIDAGVLHLDLWVMLATAVACVPVMLTGREIARWEGGLFALYYAAYTGYLVLAATGRAPMPSERAFLVAFVVTLLNVTLVVALAPRRRRAT